MRITTLTILLGAVVAAQASAQDSRFSFELAGGRGMNSPIFHHLVSDATGTFETRLAIDDGSVVGGRLGYRLDDHWTLVSDATLGSSRYYYSEFSTSSSGLGASNENWGDASRTAVGLGISRRTSFASLPLSVEPELGVGVQWLKVGTPGVACAPVPPSVGGIPPCFASERWERRYAVPSVTAGLSLGYAFTQRLAMELHGRYGVGRTSTEAAFYDDLLPQYDYAEAPKTQTVRSTTVSLGVRITP